MVDQGVTLEVLLELAGRAVSGERQLLVQLFRQLQRLAGNPRAPVEEQALAEVLGKILIGDRDLDLSGLNPEAAQEIKVWLKELNNKDQGPNLG